ncbi:MAG TPA: MBL fold metallo-hydrolase [Candidatus Polarisedimenticolaceae bacterium]|nr:MBL fold metallo-hydrolase [Candidatus Polarisedimenticolaceae bacterium]
MAASDHFDGRRFFNPGGANGQSFWRVPQLLLTPRTRWPDHVPVEPQRPPPPGGPDEIVVTFIGHASFLIQSAAGNVLTDPIYSRRASPVRFAGPRRVRAPGVAFEDLPEIAVVLVSHAHYDHCDLATLSALERRFGPLFVAPLNQGRLLRSAGLRRIVELDWWQEVAAPLEVALTPAQHFSARTPFDHNRALWGGFILRVAGRRLFFAGDSGYGPHFRQIRARYGPVDLALLPIGAYEPRWFMRDLHMNPEEAVQAHLDLESRQSLAMHFGTFQLTPEGIDAPLAALDLALDEHGVPRGRFRGLDCGGSWGLGARA